MPAPHHPTPRSPDKLGERRGPEATLDQLRGQIHRVLHHGAPTTRKALLQTLVAQIVVRSRAEIVPHFRIPSSDILNEEPEVVLDLAHKVELYVHNANRQVAIEGPGIRLN